MPAPYTELDMDQGSSFEYVINLADDITGANINVSGYSVQSQMRRSYLAANATATLECSITDAANGEITILLDSANTANIKAGKYFFDVETISPTNKTSKVLQGIIIVSPEYTK